MSQRDDILENIGALIGGWPEEAFQFGNSLSSETDRGCALRVGAYLDSQLEVLLSKRLVNNEKVQKEMFGQFGPLASFSAKIDIAYLLGLIGLKAHRDLHLIRKVRNEFGHASHPIDFTDSALASRCGELFHDPSGRQTAPRAKFTIVTMGVLGVIHANLYSITRIEEDKDIRLELARELFDKLTKVAPGNGDA